MVAKSTLIHIIITINVSDVFCKAVPKIYGGHRVKIKDAPFVIQFSNSLGSRCGGTILSRKFAITALHCLDLVKGVKHYARAGTDQLGQGGSTHRVKRVHVYNNTICYPSLKIPSFDVALIEVNPPFRFSKTIQPAKLPKGISDPPDKLYVYGWGETETGYDKSLRGTDVSYVPYEDCRHMEDYFHLVKREHHLCYGDQEKDACYGDSGGPLIDSNRILHGIVTFGCGCATVPGVYEKVAFYRRWIKGITKL